MNCYPEIVRNTMGSTVQVHLICRNHGYVLNISAIPFNRDILPDLLLAWQKHVMDEAYKDKQPTGQEVFDGMKKWDGRLKTEVL